jgi:pilus assembly protein CpaC
MAFTATIATLILAQTPPPLQARESKGKALTDTTAVRTPQGNQESVTVAINQSRVIKLRSPVARVSVANPEIADLLVLNPQQVFVVGKKIGTTNMMLWDAKDQLRESLLLEVTPDLEQLKTRLHQVMPNERVQVRSAQGTIVVSGEVSSPTKAEAAIKLAESYAASGGAGGAGGGGQSLAAPLMGGMGAGTAAGAGAGAAGGQSTVLNMLQVGGSQQVMLEVKIAEVQRSLVRQLDMNFSGFYNGGGFKMGTLTGGGYAFPNATFPLTQTVNSLTGTGTGNLLNSGAAGTLNNFTQLNSNGNLGNTYSTTSTTTTNASTLNPRLGTNVPAFAVPLAGALNNKGIFAQYLGGNFLLNAYIDAAKETGLVRILAEPNLTTLSGQEAKFQAGGEYPYQTVQATTSGAPVYTTDFKQYGIGLIFVPVVLDSGVISLKVNLSVSELDYANTNPVTEIPALRTRSANATVEIKTGQTISIAGLISEDLRESINRFPGIGDIPVLGMLFSSQYFQKRQSELVMFVTPRLANAFDPQQAKLPTDNFVEPSDLEFYLLGRTQGRKPQVGNQAPAPTGALGPDKSGSEGAFGHDL